MLSTSSISFKYAFYHSSSYPIFLVTDIHHGDSESEPQADCGPSCPQNHIGYDLLVAEVLFRAILLDLAKELNMNANLQINIITHE